MNSVLQLGLRFNLPLNLPLRLRQFMKLHLSSSFRIRTISTSSYCNLKYFGTRQLDSKYNVTFSSLHCRSHNTLNLQLVNVTHLQNIHPRNLHVRRSDNFCGPKTLESYRRRDGMPKSYELIYRSTFPNYLLCTQIVIFLTVGAFITASILFALQPELSLEEKDELRQQNRQQYEEFKKLEKETGFGKVYEDVKKKYELNDVSVSSPGLGDLADVGPNGPLVVTSCIILFGAALFRIMRLMPVRVYTNSKKHSVAILYGHVLPGRLTTHEFLAGTLRPVKRKLDFYSNAVYKDGSGKELILMEQFFRHPSDFNRIMGYDQSDINEESIRQRVREKHG